MKPLEFREIRKLEICEEHAPSYTMRGNSIVLTATSDNTEYEVVFPSATLRSMLMQPQAIKVAKNNGKKTLAPKRNFGKLAKLNEQDVIEMRSFWADPKYMATFGSKHQAMEDLAKTYKIHVTQVHKIVNRLAWKHLP
jgi:hypothetical protein